jgi:hypothetical protein
MAFQSGNVGRGIAFLIGAATVAEFIAKDVSSPQTVHLNAKKRAPTLMQWVHVGQVEAVVFLIVASMLDPSFAGSFIAGGIMEMAITEGEYLYARKLGMEQKDEPGTENY